MIEGADGGDHANGLFARERHTARRGFRRADGNDMARMAPQSFDAKVHTVDGADDLDA